MKLTAENFLPDDPPSNSPSIRILKCQLAARFTIENNYEADVGDPVPGVEDPQDALSCTPFSAQEL